MTAGAIRRSTGATGSSIGLLYFANSFGAAIGALVGGFALVPAFGLAGTLRAAALLNFVVTIGVAIGFVRQWELGMSEAPKLGMTPSEPPSFRASELQRIMLAVSFATAFSSFLYDIAWTRLLSM